MVTVPRSGVAVCANSLKFWASGRPSVGPSFDLRSPGWRHPTTQPTHHRHPSGADSRTVAVYPVTCLRDQGGNTLLRPAHRLPKARTPGVGSVISFMRVYPTQKLDNLYDETHFYFLFARSHRNCIVLGRLFERLRHSPSPRANFVFAGLRSSLGAVMECRHLMFKFFRM